MAGYKATVCDKCEPRFYQQSQGQSSCTRCPPGTASNETGLVQCNPCNLGSYQSADAQLTCLQCPIGTYQDSSAKSFCADCPAGQFNDLVNQTVCLACAAGAYSPASRATHCLFCPEGFASTTGSSTCLQCGDRQVAPLQGSSTCFACDPNAKSDENHKVCLCEIGFAGRLSNKTLAGIPQIECVRCPNGAVCDKPGTMYDTMAVQTGWWRSSSGVYYRCLLETNCQGGNNVCKANRIGPLCGYCADGYSEALDGTCNVCGRQANSIIYTLAIIVVFLILLYLLFTVMYYSGNSIMDIAAREDAKLQRIKEGFVENFNDMGYVEDQWRHGRILRYDGIPAPKPDFTFKLKIALTFVQIVTNLSVGLEIQWPSDFKTFVNWFNPANLDFVKFSSVECVRRASYFEKVAVMAAAPIALLAALVVFYLIPHTLRNVARDDEGRSWRKRVRRNFWKLFFFALFLVYPSVSATILRLYVCKNIEGVSYLMTDLREQCYTSNWYTAAYGGFVLILVYPIGIPLFFFVMLYRYARAGRLDQSGIRAELGFLYDAYERNFYLFELVDTAHKLVLLGVVPFAPFEWQLNFAMLVVTAYLIVIFVGKPYLRKADDRLHLVGQIEILLLLMAGNNFNKQEYFDATMDKVLSVFLIAGVLLFIAYFVVTFLGTVIKMCRANPCCQKYACCRKEDKKKKYSNKAETVKDENRRLYKIDRAELRQKGKVATQRGGKQDDAEITMQRSAVFGRNDVGSDQGSKKAIEEVKARRASLVALMEGNPLIGAPPSSPAAPTHDAALLPTSQTGGDVEMSTFATLSPAPATAPPVYQPATEVEPVPVALAVPEIATISAEPVAAIPVEPSNSSDAPAAAIPVEPSSDAAPLQALPVPSAEADGVSAVPAVPAIAFEPIAPIEPASSEVVSVPVPAAIDFAPLPVELSPVEPAGDAPSNPDE